MLRSRNRLPLVACAVLALAFANPAAAEDEKKSPPPATSTTPTTPSATPAPAAPSTPPADDTAEESEERAGDGRRQRQTAAERAREREELKREVLDEVERELDETRREIREEVSYVEAAEDARSYDAKELEELKRSVNLLQLHGYWRTRIDLFHNASLGRGADPTGNTLMPIAQGSDYLFSPNMRLRLNPILRVSDDIAVYGQIDVLDNVILGSNPLGEPFWDASTPAFVTDGRITGDFIDVKRLWAEVETPIGQLAFGRMGQHFGEGMFYNDGNCLDCDYGNSFDRLQLTVGPLLGGHLFILAGDMLSSGQNSTNVPNLARFGNYGQPIDVQTTDDAWRVSLQVTKIAPPEDVRRKLANGEWVFNYAALGAYRWQENDAPAFDAGATNPGSLGLVRAGAQFGELDFWFELARAKFRLAFEGAAFGGVQDNRIGVTSVPDSDALLPVSFPGQSIDFLQFAAILRAQYAFLKQDSLLVELAGGFASGDNAFGIGVRSGRPGSGPDGNTATGDIDGRQFACTSGGCSDDNVRNFVMNPDFRVDQLMWHWIFTSVSDAWLLRGEGRFKPGGRASGGADDDGFEFSAALTYSQAIYAQSTPSGVNKSLGIEADVAITYTSKDRFFLGLVGGFLLPFGGFDNIQTGEDASFAQLYRGVFGVVF